MNAGYSPSVWMRNRGTLNNAGKLALKLEEKQGVRQDVDRQRLTRERVDHRQRAQPPAVNSASETKSIDHISFGATAPGCRSWLRKRRPMAI